MYAHEKIDYVELPAKNMESTKAFFNEVFGWQFEDSGPNYMAFLNQGISGGFYRSNLTVSQDQGSALIIFYSNRLEDTEEKITKANGTISKATAFFQGGRRFHFHDPNGNEFAVWSNFDADGKICE